MAARGSYEPHTDDQRLPDGASMHMPNDIVWTTSEHGTWIAWRVDKYGKPIRCAPEERIVLMNELRVMGQAEGNDDPTNVVHFLPSDEELELL